MLTAWGMAPEDTADPEVALDWVREGRRFDLAVLDLHMPEMDRITKPVKPLVLADALLEAVQGAPVSPEPTVEDAPVSDDVARLKILVVEDNVTIQKVALGMLGCWHGWDVGQMWR